jgi:tetratricopeptide (TPR) repeat protein
LLLWRRLLTGIRFVIPFILVLACSQDSGSLFDDGQKLWQQGEYEKAAHKFEKFLGVDHEGPLVPEALFMVGTIYYNLDKYNQAIKAYERLRTNFPEDRNIPRVNENLGKIYKDLKNYEKAIPLFEELLARFPLYDRRNQVKLLLAESYLKSGRAQEAKNAYRGLLISVFRTQALFALATIYQSEGDCEEAVRLFEEVSKDSPYYLDAKLSEADCLEKEKKVDDAIRVLSDLIADAPQYKSLIELQISRIKQKRSGASMGVNNTEEKK